MAAPSGRVERMTNVPLDRYVRVVEGKGSSSVSDVAGHSMRPSIWDYVREAFNARPIGMFIPPNWVGLGALRPRGGPRWRTRAGSRSAPAPSWPTCSRWRAPALSTLRRRQIEPRRQRSDAQRRADALILSLPDADKRRYANLGSAAWPSSSSSSAVTRCAPGYGAQSDSLGRLTWMYLRLLATRQAILRVLRDAAPARASHRRSPRRRLLSQRLDERLAELRRRLADPSLARRPATQPAPARWNSSSSGSNGAWKPIRSWPSSMPSSPRIEEQVELIREQAVLSTDPEHFSQRIDEISATLGSTAHGSPISNRSSARWTISVGAATADAQTTGPRGKCTDAGRPTAPRAPVLVRRMRDLFRSGSVAQFILHGNVFDLFPLGELVSLKAFLDEGMFAGYDTVLHYDRSRGVRATKGQDDWSPWLRQALGDANPISLDPRARGGARADRSLSPAIAESAGDTAARRTASAPASRRARKIAVVIDFAEFVVPRGDALQLGGPFAANVVKVLGWANDPAILQANIVTVLLVEGLHDLNPLVVENPHVADIRLPLPSEAEMLAYLEALKRSQLPDLEAQSDLPLADAGAAAHRPEPGRRAAAGDDGDAAAASG